MTHDSRGHYGIAMVEPAHPENAAAVARATGCFNADYMVIVGGDYEIHPASVGHDRHTPIWSFDDFGSLCNSLPHDTDIVAVDYDETATELRDFNHPKRALYVLGEEGPGFERHPEVIDYATNSVYISAEYCMNVAVAGNMVLQDRYYMD